MGTDAWSDIMNYDGLIIVVAAKRQEKKLEVYFGENDNERAMQ